MQAFGEAPADRRPNMLASIQTYLEKLQEIMQNPSVLLPGLSYPPSQGVSNVPDSLLTYRRVGHNVCLLAVVIQFDLSSNSSITHFSNLGHQPWHTLQLTGPSETFISSLHRLDTGPGLSC